MISCIGSETITLALSGKKSQNHDNSTFTVGRVRSPRTETVIFHTIIRKSRDVILGNCPPPFPYTRTTRSTGDARVSFPKSETGPSTLRRDRYQNRDRCMNERALI